MGALKCRVGAALSAGVGVRFCMGSRPSWGFQTHRAASGTKLSSQLKSHDAREVRASGGEGPPTKISVKSDLGMSPPPHSSPPIEAPRGVDYGDAAPLPQSH